MAAASDNMLLERALRIAAAAHRDQVRKCSDVPYFVHCAAVALILARFGFDDEELLAAAVLHDVVEDTDVSLEQLAEAFPPATIEAVAALSERKSDSDGQLRPWEDRKTEHLRHIADAPLNARAIALADKLHNMQTMRLDLSAGTLTWGAFRASPERLLWYYRSMIDAAGGDDSRLAALAKACYTAWEQLRVASKIATA